MADPVSTTIWNQGWVEAGQLGLMGYLLIEWNAYIREMKLAHVRSTLREDRLVWDYHPNGLYMPKAGYIKLATDQGQGIQLWW